MVVLSEGDREALLAGSKPLVTPGSTLAEAPVSSLVPGALVDRQLLTEHVAAPIDVP